MLLLSFPSYIVVIAVLSMTCLKVVLICDKFLKVVHFFGMSPNKPFRAMVPHIIDFVLKNV